LQLMNSFPWIVHFTSINYPLVELLNQ